MRPFLTLPVTVRLVLLDEVLETLVDGGADLGREFFGCLGARRLGGWRLPRLGRLDVEQRLADRVLDQRGPLPAIGVDLLPGAGRRAAVRLRLVPLQRLVFLVPAA